MVESRERFTVNDPDIREMCARVERFLAREGMEERERTRLRLTVERLLRRIGERRGRWARCELALGRRWGRAVICLTYPGEAFDPTLAGREGESEAWSARLLTDLGLVPEWSWRRGLNRLLLRPRARERWALWAPLLAAALGIVLRFALDAAAWTEAANRLVLTPLVQLFFGLSSLLISWKLFFAFLVTARGAAETASSRVGRLAVTRFAAFGALWTLLGSAAIAALCGARFTGAVDLAPLRSLVPDGRMLPQKNAVQLALLGAASGAAIHALDGRAERLREWAEQCDAVLGELLEALCRLTSAAVFAAVCRAPCPALLAAWKPFAAFALCALAIVLCCLGAAAIRLRARPDRLAKRVLPPLGAALRAGSFAAAFGAAMDNCENELGVAHPMVLTGLSVGGALWRPMFALCLSAQTLCILASRGTAIGIGTLLLIALTALALALALPERPGMLLLALTLMPGMTFLTASESALAAVLDAPFAALIAALGVAALQGELLTQAKQAKLLNTARWK